MIVLLGLAVTACGSSSKSTTPTPSGGASTGSSSGPVALKTGKVAGLGTVLVDGTGRTVYVFAPDKAMKVTCTGSCASVWPPLKVASGQKPTLSGGVKASLVSSDSDPSGGSVVTYNGWPLYLYVADPSSGTAHGQALNSSGGVWHVISASGQVITKKAGAGASTNGSGY